MSEQWRKVGSQSATLQIKHVRKIVVVLYDDPASKSLNMTNFRSLQQQQAYWNLVATPQVHSFQCLLLIHMIADVGL